MKRAAICMALTLLLGACTSFSPDGGMGPVEQAAREHLGPDTQLLRYADDAAADSATHSASQRVAELLRTPLSAQSAVQIALLNNRGLQASLQELGVAEADLVQASRLPNPGLRLGRSQRADEREIDRSVSFSLGRLLALPLLRKLEDRRFLAVQRSVTQDMLTLAAQTRIAHVQAVAAGQTLHYMVQVKRAADASATLAARMAQVGNFSKLQHAREQSFYAEATLNLARATQAQVAARERLTRLLGLWGAQAHYTLPKRLPELPTEPADQPELERTAMAQRLDVQAARLQVQATAQDLGLTRATRFVSVLEFSAQRNSSNQAPTQTGYEIGFEIPLFDWSEARVARAQALYTQSAHRAAQTAIEARSEVREAYLHYRTSWSIARHYRDEIVPAAKRISDENLLRYNGMLIGVFELLADTRSQIATVNAAIEAQRDFWLAQAELDMALIGKPAR